MKANDTAIAHSVGTEDMGNDGGLSGHRWRSVAVFAVCAVLAILGALCFLRYLGWAAFYSGILGLPSRAFEAQVARHKAYLFFWSFVVLEGMAALTMATLIRFTGISSTALRIVARLAISLALSLVMTGGLVGLLTGIGSKLRRN